MLVCLASGSRALAAVTASERFAVSVLGADQQDLAAHFARRDRPAGLAQFHGVPHRTGRRTGAPVLEGAAAWLECGLESHRVAGDHEIVVGTVLAAGVGAPASGALLFQEGRFGHRPPALQGEAA